MKRILTLALFLCASTWAFAQYNHVEVGLNGNKTAEGQYNANPGINPGDSKETIATKMSTVYKIGTWKYWFESTPMARRSASVAALKTPFPDWPAAW